MGRSFLSRFVVPGLAFAALLGCGQSTGPVADIFPTVPAAGVLIHKGKPLPNYQVTFTPPGESRPASGITDAEGKFVLGTNEVNDGAIPGTHIVSVAWVNPDDDASGDPVDSPKQFPKPPADLPAAYSDPVNSGILVEVPEGGSTELVVELP